MPFGGMTEHLDVALIVTYAFWIFFFGLIVWLRREDRREGYPLERENSGTIKRPGPINFPKPKEFKLPHGGVTLSPNFEERDNARPIAAEKVNGLPGSPYVPTGDPMIDGVGPAAYVPRKNEPERTRDGKPLIVPMSKLEGYWIPKASTDPRGFDVVGADKEKGGTVKDLWVDQADKVVRYIEVEVSSGEGGGPTVLLPMVAARVNRDKERLEVASIMGNQFAKVPKVASSSQITAAEEERIQAYYAGGRMYAHPSRQEPIV